MFTSLSYSVPSSIVTELASAMDAFRIESPVTTGFVERSFPYSNCWEDDGVIHLQLAVAGYKEDDLSIDHVGDTLTIKGRADAHALVPEKATVHWKNVAQRSFTRRFKLAAGASVVSASLENGMLEVVIKREPEEATKVKIMKK